MSSRETALLGVDLNAPKLPHQSGNNIRLLDRTIGFIWRLHTCTTTTSPKKRRMSTNTSSLASVLASAHLRLQARKRAHVCVLQRACAHNHWIANGWISTTGICDPGKFSAEIACRWTDWTLDTRGQARQRRAGKETVVRMPY